MLRNVANTSSRVILLEDMDKGVIRKTEPDGVLASFYNIRQGFLAFATFYFLNVEIDESRYTAKIKAAWENFWLGIKGD